jgi:hypothetical protein
LLEGFGQGHSLAREFEENGDLMESSESPQDSTALVRPNRPQECYPSRKRRGFLKPVREEAAAVLHFTAE